MNFYSSEKVNENLTCIRSRMGELMYLLEGDTSAILIDSCAGIGHLRAYVETLTKKPVTLVLTHGHVDHAMGAPEFDSVYMNPKDIPLYQKQCSMEERKGYVGAGLGELAAELCDDDYTISKPDYPFQRLEDGMTIEAAPYHLDAYAFPGHTPGCMCFVIREMRILILGDACNNATFLFDENSMSVETYLKEVIQNRARLEGKYDQVFLSHYVMKTGNDILKEMEEVCGCILKGEADDLPFSFMGMQACIAKKCNEKFERNDKKSANLIYSKAKIHEER